jgi:RNA polymerase sigma-70 factor (ECF subfamily)
VTGFSELLEGAKRGDPGALTLLYERYADPVIRSIRKRLSQPLRRKFDTMDLSQSVFTEVLRDLPRFQDLGETAFHRWLYLKVESKIGGKLRKHLGRAGRRLERPIDSGASLVGDAASPASEVAENEESNRARDLLTVLDEAQREIVFLRLEEGLPFAEIAERTGLPSAEAARKRYGRAIARLRVHWPG